MAALKQISTTPKINMQLSDKRIKHFIQMLDIKKDTNMTRIYSAIYQSDFFNPKQNK